MRGDTCVRVFAAWGGHIARNHGGWEKLPPVQVGIRLSAGLTGWWGQDVERKEAQGAYTGGKAIVESAFVCGVLPRARPERDTR